MSIQVMRGLLQMRLLALGWTDQTAFEGKPFTPTPGVPYQELTTVFSEPDAITLAHSDMQRGLFQVRLLYPLSTGGIGPQTARAELIAAAFPRNLQILGSGFLVKVMRKPAITRGPPQGDRDVTIIRIRFSDR